MNYALREPDTRLKAILSGFWRWLRRLIFVVLAGFILLSPSLPQLFGVTHLFLRPWVMYAGVGTGLLKGTFVVTRAAGGEDHFTPLQVLGRTRYVFNMNRKQSYEVHSEEDLHRFAQRLCGRLEPGDRLDFDGWYSTVRGWQPVEGRELCRVDG